MLEVAATNEPAAMSPGKPTSMQDRQKAVPESQNWPSILKEYETTGMYFENHLLINSHIYKSVTTEVTYQMYPLLKITGNQEVSGVTDRQFTLQV